MGSAVTPPRPGNCGGLPEPAWLLKLSVVEVYQEVVTDLLAEPQGDPDSSYCGPSGSQSGGTAQQLGGRVSWSGGAQTGDRAGGAVGQRLQVRVSEGARVDGARCGLVEAPRLGQMTGFLSSCGQGVGLKWMSMVQARALT